MTARGKSLQEILEIESIDWSNFWTDIINIKSTKKFRAYLGDLPFDYFKLFKARFAYRGKVVRSYKEVAEFLGLDEDGAAERCRRILNRCLNEIRKPQYSFRWNLDIPYRDRLSILRDKYGPYANFVPTTKTMNKEFWRERHAK